MRKWIGLERFYINHEILESIGLERYRNIFSLKHGIAKCLSGLFKKIGKNENMLEMIETSRNEKVLSGLDRKQIN